LGYLYGNAVLPNKTYAALRNVWQEARARLNPGAGSPVPNPGTPEILDIPAGHENHLKDVQASPRFQKTVGTLPWQFKLVEIGPLLAFQYHVQTDHANQLWLDAGGTTDLAALLRLCLPTDVKEIQPGAGCDANIDPKNSEERGRVTFESDNLNMRILAGGNVGMDGAKIFWAGIGFGEATRLVQVARLAGRCYLKNGYHRSYRMRAEGVTHLPCIFQDVNGIAETGVRSDGTTFNRKFMQSTNPPVCAHYGKGYALSVRSPKRSIELTWSQTVRFA